MNEGADTDVKDRLAHAAYDAYCATRDWKSYNNEPLPQWAHVREDIKQGWVAAALAVIEEAEGG